MTDRSTTTLDSPTAGDDVGMASGESTHPLAETGREAGERASHLAERGAEIGFRQADRGLNQAAEGVETVADSIRRVSVDMETEQPQIAELASTAADQAEAIAGYLRETDVRQMIGNVENFARRQPLLFLGGAFLLGVAASRFVKAAGGAQRQGEGQWQASDLRSGNGHRTGTPTHGTGTGHWAATAGSGDI